MFEKIGRWVGGKILRPSILEKAWNNGNGFSKFSPQKEQPVFQITYPWFKWKHAGNKPNRFQF